MHIDKCRQNTLKIQKEASFPNSLSKVLGFWLEQWLCLYIIESQVLHQVLLHGGNTGKHPNAAT